MDLGRAGTGHRFECIINAPPRVASRERNRKHGNKPPVRRARHFLVTSRVYRPRDTRIWRSTTREYEDARAKTRQRTWVSGSATPRARRGRAPRARSRPGPATDGARHPSIAHRYLFQRARARHTATDVDDDALSDDAAWCDE